MSKKWFRALLRKRLAVCLLIILQIAFIYYIIQSTGRISVLVTETLSAISVMVVLYVIGADDSSEFKITWTFTILALPVFGGLLYLIIKLQADSIRFKENWVKSEKRRMHMELDDTLYNKLVKEEAECLSHVTYLQKNEGFEVYNHTASRYYRCGEEAFPDILSALKEAKKYIFLEFFIISEGSMWDEMLKILTQKAKEGVEVRMIYDDVGCLMRLPKNYPKLMEAQGIKCKVFNPFRAYLSSVQNNRDHRKILCIDGKTAFCGGINLADEYINEFERFGYWKDSVLKLNGEGAWGFSKIFLGMWDWLNNEEEDFNFFYPWKKEACKVRSDGYVIAFADSPFDSEKVSEQVYLRMINRADNYVYIFTPYLMVDDALSQALSGAAKSGVDVRILTPHIADKKLVYATTRSFYPSLLASGVKIYEFTPGFVHSKLIVSDDKYAIVGSSNMDFRSFNLQFECGAWLYKTNSVKHIRTDALETMAQSRQITPEDCHANFFTLILQSVLRLFAPLM